LTLHWKQNPHREHHFPAERMTFMQARSLRGKKLLLIGFTLFSMFFGAGNLIFPPYLGAQAGANLWPAFFGFAVSAIGLPIAAVVAVARADGLPALAGRVHPVFSQVFTILAYLSIGPCLAIPRTASTSFEMLTPPSNKHFLINELAIAAILQNCLCNSRSSRQSTGTSKQF